MTADQTERDERIDESLGQQRNHDSDESGQHRADKGNEGAEKHQRCQRQRQRDSHDGQAGADADGVNEGDHRRGTHVTGE